MIGKGFYGPEGDIELALRHGFQRWDFPPGKGPRFMLITAADLCTSSPKACKQVGALSGPLGLEVGAGVTARPSNLIRPWR